MRICPECNTRTEDFICPVCSTNTITEDEYVRLHADPDELIGKVLMERYKVTRLVGIGGMGNVYEARHLLFDKRFAVKVIKKSLVDNREAVKRFQREALLASKLDHPNIVKVYDFGETDSEQQFILMEFVDGESLRELLKREKRLSPFRTAGLFLQMAKAIEYAHNKKLVHRDLKPDNIFVRHINGEDFVKIVDFGVAKLLQDDSSKTLTKEGYTPGTPEYMSPEQVLAKEDVDGRSDLYSMGLIVYEMLTGIRPFKRETPLASAVAHLNDKVPKFDMDLRARLPKGMEELIFQLIARKPSKRPESASVVIARLKQLRFDSASVAGDAERLAYVRTPGATRSLTPFSTTDLTKKMDSGVTRHDALGKQGKKMTSGVWIMAGIIGIGLAIAAAIIIFGRGRDNADKDTRAAGKRPSVSVRIPNPEPRPLYTGVMSVARRTVALIPDMPPVKSQKQRVRKQLKKRVNHSKPVKRKIKTKTKKVTIPRW